MSQFKNIRNILRKQEGVGLIEVLVSMIVLGFMVTILAKYQGDNRKAIHHTKHRNEATQIAETILDSLQHTGLNQIDTGSVVLDTVDRMSDLGVDFVVSAEISVLDSVHNANFFTALKTIIEVKWKRAGSQDSTSITIDGVVQ